MKVIPENERAVTQLAGNRNASILSVHQKILCYVGDYFKDVDMTVSPEMKIVLGCIALITGLGVAAMSNVLVGLFIFWVGFMLVSPKFKAKWARSWFARKLKTEEEKPRQ